MQQKIIQWIIEQLLGKLTPDMFKLVFCDALRALAALAVAAAAKTDPAKYGPIAAVDDVIAKKLSDAVEEVCKSLGH